MPRFAWPAEASFHRIHRWRPPGPAWRRRLHAGAVLAGVALAHAWLIGPLQQPLGRAKEPGRAPVMQVVAVAPSAAPAEAAATPTPEPTPEPAATPEPEPTSPALVPEPAPEAVAATEAAQPPDDPPDDRPVDWTAGPRPPEAVAGTEVTPADVPQPVVAQKPMLLDEAASAAAAAATEAAGRRPPVYQTVLPNEGFRLAYRVERGESSGRGQFRVDLLEDGRYRAHLQAEDGQRMVMDWVSHGRFDAAGVAPERMVERQRGRDARAVNFQRDQGVISFSGSTRALALMDGAQDRASVLLQLMAIAQAQPGGLRAGQTLRLQVASSRGLAVEWMFEVAGEEPIEAAGQRVAAVRLVREPAQPYDQRVEVWLARAAGHLPVGLRLTTVPGKEPVGVWLDGPLPGTGRATAPP
jgi:hypothetical protein